jgi:PAS domain S-box-containing protein
MKSRKLKRPSYSLKIFLTFGIPWMLIVCFVLLYYPSVQRLSNEQFAKKQIETLGDVLAFSVGTGLSESNFDLVQKAFNWSKKDSNVSYLAILDESDKLIFDYNPQNRKIDPSSYTHMLELMSENECITNSTPIIVKSKRLGTIILSYSLENVNQTIRNQQIISIAVSLIILLVALRGGLLLSRQAKDLHKAILKAEEQASIVMRQSDALAETNRSLEKSNDTLELARSELQQARDELEERVKDRTIDLANANDALKHEINEKELAEKILRESEERYRNLFDNNPHPMWVYDMETLRFLAVNDSAVRHYGYSRDEFLEMDLQNIRPMSEVDALVQMVPKLKKGINNSGVWKHAKKDGSVIDVEITSHGLQFGGRGARVVLANDVTERLRADQALRKSENELRALFEAMHDIIIVVDSDGMCKQIGPTKTSLGDRISEKFLDKKVYEFMSADKADNFLSLFRMTLENQQTQNLEFSMEVEGSEVWFDGNISALSEGTVLLVARDITLRKHSEEQLRKLSAGVEQSPASIVITNLRGDIEYVNPKFVELTGYSQAEALGQNPRILKSGETSPDEYKELWRTLCSGNEWRGEFHNKKKNGELYWEYAFISPIKNNFGEITHFIAIKEDTTTKKGLEKQLLRSQRLESLGTLAGGIAHDLNNVLAPIVMSIELLRDRYNDEKGDRWLNTIQASAQRGADIVKQVLTFARGMEGERVVLQPRHILREVEKIIRETFPRNLNIKSDISKDLWTMSGNATQIHQVFMNLSVNARDAMPNGGVLSLEAENIMMTELNARFNIDAKPGPYILFTVTDTGSGIDSKNIDKIFDPFFTTKEIGKGTGLGLSTVLTIVKNHKGFVTVDSEFGRGTKFKIYFPASESIIIDSVVASTKEFANGNGESILVVDDEAGIREITKATLESFGYRVLTAADGKEAISIFIKYQNEIDLILTDMMMPNMDGVAVIKEVSKLDPNIKIIAASGLADVDKLSEINGANVKAFIPKPYKSEKLLEVIKTVLENAA